MKQNTAGFQPFVTDIKLKSKTMNKLIDNLNHKCFLDVKVSTTLRQELQERALNKVKKKVILVSLTR